MIVIGDKNYLHQWLSPEKTITANINMNSLRKFTKIVLYPPCGSIIVFVLCYDNGKEKHQEICLTLLYLFVFPGPTTSFCVPQVTIWIENLSILFSKSTMLSKTFYSQVLRRKNYPDKRNVNLIMINAW